MRSSSPACSSWSNTARKSSSSWKSSKSGTWVSTVTGLVASMPSSSMNLTLISNFIIDIPPLGDISNILPCGEMSNIYKVNLNRTGGNFLWPYMLECRHIARRAIQHGATIRPNIRESQPLYTAIQCLSIFAPRFLSPSQSSNQCQYFASTPLSISSFSRVLLSLRSFNCPCPQAFFGGNHEVTG